jgi:hypothetical protein
LRITYIGQSSSSIPLPLALVFILNYKTFWKTINTNNFKPNTYFYDNLIRF